MSDIVLGELAVGPMKRDAVHVAVATMIASERLSPGQPVEVIREGIAGPADRASAVGVVDPFLRVAVPAGARFVMCLYPGTVTGLRHEWSHPDFEDAAKDDDYSDECRGC